jgi:hypothetical protein
VVALISFVMPGLDLGIHVDKTMDCRVKCHDRTGASRIRLPGNDDKT